MTDTPLNVIDDLMSLRAKSWRQSKKEDDLLKQLHSTIIYRSFLDKEIDKLETKIMEWQKAHCNEPEPKGFFGWVK